MTVGELKKAIEGLDDDTTVLFLSDEYGEWVSPPLARVAKITPLAKRLYDDQYHHYLVFYHKPGKRIFYRHIYPLSETPQNTNKTLALVWRHECGEE